MSYYYPFNFLNEALSPGTAASESATIFETATGLSGLGGQSGCPTPDFPITLEYLDPTQIFTYNTPMLEKRIFTAHKLLRSWTINYQAITNTELAYLRTFYIARKGKWDSFYFIDPDRYTFDSTFPFNLDYTPDIVTNTDYVAKARFNSPYSVQRMNKNWYTIEFQIVEIF